MTEDPFNPNKLLPVPIKPKTVDTISAPPEKKHPTHESPKSRLEKKNEIVQNMVEQDEINIKKLFDFTDKIEKEMLKRGGFDFLRPGFWKDLEEIEKSLSPEKPPVNLFEKEFVTGIPHGSEYDVYFRRLIIIDAFYYIKQKGLLTDNERELFLSSIPPFRFFWRWDRTDDENYFSNPKMLKTSLANSDLDKKYESQKMALLEIINHHTGGLQELSKHKNIDDIEKTVMERQDIDNLIRIISGYVGRQELNKILKKEVSPITQEQFINDENLISIYLKHKETINEAGESFNDSSSGQEWGHYYPKVIQTSLGSIKQLLIHVEKFKKLLSEK